MLCALSGEAPQQPVVSRKSGNVFEKRLIEAYIAENGKDPLTGAELSTDDLVEVKSARVVRPRPPTLTSIPSLLSVFQNEWDALALETYTLRQQLSQTRQELSTALYQHDAAVRVIGRLLQERDEARDALSKITASGVINGNGDEMQVDNNEVPEDVKEKVTVTHTELSSGRRKRPVPDGWATSEDIQSFTTTSTSESLYPGGKSISINDSQDLALVGGIDGLCGIYSLSKSDLSQTLNAPDGAVTDVLWWNSRPVVASASGTVRIWDEQGKDSTVSTPHAGQITGISLHPCKTLLGSVGVDKSYALHDLESSKLITQVYNDTAFLSAHFHPDGHLFGAGTSDSQIKIFDVRENKVAAAFESDTGSAKSIQFSENGFWLAATSEGQDSISIWDLRKAAVAKTIDIGARVESLRWDYTGQYLATAGPQGVTVQHYAKSSKSWSEPLRSAVPAIALAWGTNAHSLITYAKDGVITVLGTKA